MNSVRIIDKSWSISLFLEGIFPVIIQGYNASCPNCLLLKKPSLSTDDLNILKSPISNLKNFISKGIPAKKFNVA